MLGYTARFCLLELVRKLINIFFWSTKGTTEFVLNWTRCKSL